MRPSERHSMKRSLGYTYGASSAELVSLREKYLHYQRGACMVMHAVAWRMLMHVIIARVRLTKRKRHLQS